MSHHHGGWHKLRRLCKDCGDRYAQELGLCRTCQAKHICGGTPLPSPVERPRSDSGEFTVVVSPKPQAARTSWWTEPATREEFDQRVADRWR
jgi:hypothetical protein